MISILLIIALILILIERKWPANLLPSVRFWWIRVAVINSAQAAILLLAGITWDRAFQKISLFHLQDHVSAFTGALICYFISTFIYYWWHRIRHESSFFWRLCHQLHHSARRIEILTSFYKHPVEITLNSLISATLTYLILGISVESAAIYTFLTAIAEYFYHWNIKTPYWLGPWFQRPESHRVHHQYQHHTQNYADLPIWDILFKTYHNPETSPAYCGFDAKREANLPAMLSFKDVYKTNPTCIGCRKRWACYTQKQTLKQS